MSFSSSLGGGRAKIHVSDFAAVARHDRRSSPAGAAPCGRLAAGPRPQAHVIADGTALKNVIPGGNAQNRDRDIRVVIFNRPAFPVVVVARMREPVEKIRSERGRELGVRSSEKLNRG